MILIGRVGFFPFACQGFLFHTHLSFVSISALSIIIPRHCRLFRFNTVLLFFLHISLSIANRIILSSPLTTLPAQSSACLSPAWPPVPPSNGNAQQVPCHATEWHAGATASLQGGIKLVQVVTCSMEIPPPPVAVTWKVSWGLQN